MSADKKCIQPYIHKVFAWTKQNNLLLNPDKTDIDKDVSASKLVSFADDTRLYSGVGDVADYDKLQLDLNAVYDWASSNMFFNSKKFSYVCFSICLPISQICILTLQ